MCRCAEQDHEVVPDPTNLSLALCRWLEFAGVLTCPRTGRCQGEGRRQDVHDVVEELQEFTLKETQSVPTHAASSRRRTSSSVLGMRISSAFRTAARSPPYMDGGIEILTGRSAPKPQLLLSRKKKYHVLG